MEESFFMNFLNSPFCPSYDNTKMNDINGITKHSFYTIHQRHRCVLRVSEQFDLQNELAEPTFLVTLAVRALHIDLIIMARKIKQIPTKAYVGIC